MTDDEILGGILRRYLTDETYRYAYLGADWLTLDGKITLTPEESAVLARLLEDDRDVS